MVKNYTHKPQLGGTESLQVGQAEEIIHEVQIRSGKINKSCGRI